MRRLTLAAALALLAGMALAPYGCGTSQSPAGPTEGGAEAAAMLPDAGEDGSADAALLGPPDSDGWRPFLGYDPSCSFSVPATKAALPAPPTWEDCPLAMTERPTLVCREVSLLPNGDNVGRAEASMHGTTLLSPIVTSSPFIVPFIVWDIDGPVRTGFRVNDSACGLFSSLGSVEGNHWVLGVRDSRSGQYSEYSSGVIAGTLDGLVPSVAIKFPGKVGPDFAASEVFGIVEQTSGPLQLLDWNDPNKLTTVTPNGSYAQNYAFAFGSALFWAADGNNFGIQKVYLGDGGARDFIVGGNTPPAAADLGTDGTDLVWTEGTGGWTDGLPTVLNIMTAPFTTDPASLKPRRLRSEQTFGYGTTPFVVGCGYAMRGITSAMRIVRLSDGVSWLLNATAHWTWETAITINCNEAFIDVIEKPSGRRGKTDAGGLVRVRLDSLGPGIAPD